VWRVAGADLHADVREFRIEGGQLAQRPAEVLLHVVAQRTQRRDIEDAGFIGQKATLPGEVVDGGQERREGFSSAGRGGDQRVQPGANRGPAFPLRLGGPAEAFGKPRLNRRMKPGQRQTPGL
jgi:hypothetical protein